MNVKKQEIFEYEYSEVQKSRISARFSWFGIPIFSFSWLREVLKNHSWKQYNPLVSSNTSLED